MNFFIVALLGLAQVAVPPQEAVVPAELTVQAGVLLRNGDLKKVARTPVTLLNADFAQKLLEVFPKGVRSARLQGNVYVQWKILAEMGGRLESNRMKQIQAMDEFIRAHTVATAVTDFDGKATIQAPPGDYFLYSHFEIGAGNLALWNVPIQLKAGKNDIVLDQNNTAK